MKAVINTLPDINEIAMRLRNTSPELGEQRIELLKTVITPISEMIKGFASNPVTGIPLMMAFSDSLFRLKLLPREIALLLLSPTAAIQIGGDLLDQGFDNIVRRDRKKLEEAIKASGAEDAEELVQRLKNGDLAATAKFAMASAPDLFKPIYESLFGWL